MPNEENGALSPGVPRGVDITWTPEVAAARGEEGVKVEAVYINASGWVHAFDHEGNAAWLSPSVIAQMRGTNVMLR